MKSVLFVCNGLYRGGTEKTLVEAMNLLDPSQYDITLYVRRNVLTIKEYINDNVKIIVNTLPESQTFLSSTIKKVSESFGFLSDKMRKRIKKLERKTTLNAYFNKQAKEYFKNKEYDYAVAYDMAQECLDFVLKKIKAKKKIYFFHGSDMGKTKAKSCAFFDKIVGVNSLVAEGIKGKYPSLANKVIDIENYINPQWVIKELSSAEEVVLPNKDLKICTVGRISPEKGFDLAVKAAKILKDKGVSFQWFFLGDVYDGGETQKLIIEEGMQENITVVGFLESPFGYMNACDIYVQPSLQEAHATTIVEASILKKSIVSTDTIAGTYFNKKYKNCELCEKNPNSLAETILSLYNDKEKMNALIKASEDIDYEILRSEYKRKIYELLS